jgi:metal-responsive CopG/Arc/MetJ family transcriptional regulator
MKTAISLPDTVFEMADSLAEKLHVSRSQLYVMALEKFIRENQESDTTNRINEFIDKNGQPVDDVLLNLAVTDMKKVEW